MPLRLTGRTALDWTTGFCHALFVTLPQAVRLLLRASLALPMIASGTARLIPVQMPPLRPVDLLQRLGELTQGELLRTLVGASPAFQSFTGLAALLGGALLLFPRTALAGALICAANLGMAVALSFCYDLPKLLPVFLLFVAVLLLAPDLRRLVDLFLLDRTVEPAGESTAGRWPERALLLLGLGILAWSLVGAALQYRRLYPPKPPFHGAWEVEELVLDGKESADPRQWRWVLFQDPGALDVEIRIGSRKRYALDLDMAGRTMRLGGRGDLSFTEPEPGVLLLEGRLEGRPARAKLRRMYLSGPWFHWILEPEWTLVQR